MAKMIYSLMIAMIMIVSMARCDVIMVFEYCRHGARGSLADLSNGSQWINDWGVEQLTGIGMRMQHYLGRTMKNNYHTIFDKDFTPDHMDAYATNFNRTIASGLSQFTGIFDMFKGPELPFDEFDTRLQPPKLTIDPKVGFKTALPKGYTPIPIISKLNQRKMQIIKEDCPYGNKRALDAQKSLGEYLMSKPKVLELAKKGALEYGISDISDINYKGKKVRSIDIETLFYLGDFVIQDYLHNPSPTIPKTMYGKPAPLYHQLETGYSIATMSRFNDTEFTRAVISELLYEILEYMDRKISDKSYAKRFVLYSGHDDMMTAIMLAIGYLDQTCLIDSLVDGEYRECRQSPDLASSIVWELHDEYDSHFVKVKYNADFVDFCGLGNKNNEYRCSIEEFAKRLEAVGNKDYKDWCLYGDEKQVLEGLEKIWRYIVISLLICLIIVVIGCSATTYKVYSRLDDANQQDNILVDQEEVQYASIAVKPEVN